MTEGSARVIIEVVAGVIPEQPDPHYTKRWGITSGEWEAAGKGQQVLLAERAGQATGYASLLMTSPDAVNWVRLDWLWL